MKWILLGLTLILLPSCSVYRVTHDELYESGEKYSTSITSLVPPGGKELSKGNADIKQQYEEGKNWQIRVGAELDTDMTGTAQMLVQMVDILATLKGEIAALKMLSRQPAAPLVVPAPTRVPTPPVDDLNR